MKSRTLFVLRTAVSLGELWLRQGKYHEARALVENANQEMTEELLPLDLIEVNALLSACLTLPVQNISLSKLF